MDPSDADLMARWRRGDGRAFEAIVLRWQRPVARFLARLAGADAADLTQDVFLRVYQQRDRYREGGVFATWIYRIALNIARDAYRRRRPTLRVAEVEQADSRLSAEDDLAQRELAAEVERALAELPPPLREVLVLRHYEGVNFEQMARLLGTPASTLKSRFAVALNRLQTRLAAFGWPAEEKHK